MSERSLLAPALLSASLVLGAASCTTEATPYGDVPKVFDEPGTSSPEQSIPPQSPEPEAFDPEKARQEKLASLLGANSSINIIYVDVPNAVVPEKNFFNEGADEFVTKLLARDKTVLNSFVSAFEDATYGRYVPKSVLVTEADAVSLTDGCIDKDHFSDNQKIQDAAAASSKDDAINIIALDAEPCGQIDDIFGINGYSAQGSTPIFLRKSFSINAITDPQYADTAVHEFGHSAGLEHAGKAQCSDISALEDCTIDVTADQNSVMSYEGGSATKREAFRFTAPELHILGLLLKSEVIINPTPGSVRLVPMDRKGAKLIVDTTDNDEPRFISYETDRYAAYDIACAPISKQGYNAKSLYAIQTGDKEYDCFKSAETGLESSLQVRFGARLGTDVLVGARSAGEQSLAMVDVRDDSLLEIDPRDDAKVTDGYAKVGTVVYENDDRVYTFTAATSDVATVKVTGR